MIIFPENKNVDSVCLLTLREELSKTNLIDNLVKIIVTFHCDFDQMKWEIHSGSKNSIENIFMVCISDINKVGCISADQRQKADKFIITQKYLILFRDGLYDENIDIDEMDRYEVITFYDIDEIMSSTFTNPAKEVHISIVYYNHPEFLISKTKYNKETEFLEILLDLTETKSDIYYLDLTNIFDYESLVVKQTF